MKRTNNRFEILRKIVLFFFISVCGISGFLLAKELLFDPFISDSQMNEVRELKIENQYDEVCDFQKLLEANPDTKGWIKIDNTPIDYPVVQSCKDPIFYLDKNFEKHIDKNGSIFINAYTGVFDKDTQNIVMHGHSMKSKKMFARLLDYADMDFMKKHHVIRFDSIYEPGKWKVFAIIKTNADEKNGKIFDYFSPTFDFQYQFLKLINEIRERSLLNIPVDVQENDKIISLSTCSYETDDARTVVFARKIRAGESEEIDFEKITKNNNPVMPQGWNKNHKR